MVRAALHGDPPADRPPQEPDNLPWCKCGKCRAMPTSTENVCCKHRNCISNTELFESTVLDLNVLNVAILNRSDIFVESPDYSPSSYRKAAYRQFVLWQEGRLGRGNRKVVPSCVVWAVRNHYPAPDGLYLGFKEY